MARPQRSRALWPMVKLAKSGLKMNIFEETHPARVDEGQNVTHRPVYDGGVLSALFKDNHWLYLQ